jgi:hypothetical protein
MNKKIRTLIITLIAAGGIATAAVAPAVSQAQDNRSGVAGLTQEELEKGGASCEHAGEDFWVCTDGSGHEWYCNHEGCGQVKITMVGTKLFHILTGLKVKSVPVVHGRPVVVVKVAPRATAIR